jgi:Conjugative transposon protein TcpC
VSGPVRVEVRGARALRLRALAPRLLLYATLGALALAGLRAVAEGQPAPRVATRSTKLPDPAVEAFAQGFARAYLSVDPAHPEARERALSAYLTDSLDPDAGLAPGRAPERVLSTTVAGERRDEKRTLVTVAADTDRGLLHLSVPVARDPRGFLAVASYPALVGPPPLARDLRAPEEDDVEDPALRAVAERAVRNYLAGRRDDLLADLAPGAVVSLPERPLHLRSTDAITWARPRRLVAVEVEAADPTDQRLTLRYELAVVRRDRWYVRSIEVDPTSKGGP